MLKPTTNVFTIELDLGFELEDLINNEINSLSEESQKLLDNSIENALEKQKVKFTKREAKTKQDQQLNDTLTAVYNKLLGSIKDGVPVATIMEVCKPTIETLTSFQSKFKAFMRTKGNPYYLAKVKKNKVQYYYLLPFNETTEV